MTDYIAFAHDLYEIAQSAQTEEEAQTMIADRIEQSQYLKALARLESAVDLYLGRSAWTQTKQLKGASYRELLRQELLAAHDAARAVLKPFRAPL